MAKKFLVNIDLGGNQLISARVQNGTASPTSYGKGQLWFDSTNNIFNVYNGSIFEEMATRSYVTGLGYQTSSGSVSYSTNAGNATTVTNGVYTTDTGTVTSTMIADGTIVNGDISSAAGIVPSKLSASSITIAGTTVGLGGTISSIGVGYLSASTVTVGSTAIGLGGTSTTLAGLTNVNSTSFVGTLYGNATTATNATTVTNGVYTTDTGTVTSTMIADGTIVNGDISSTAAITPNKLSASTVTIGSTSLGLGGTQTTVSGLTSLSASTLNAVGTTDSSNTTSGALIVSGGAGIAKNLYVGGNLDVSGSVYVSGSAFTVSSSNITLFDSLIYLANANPSNLVDIGFVGHFNDGTYQHTGLVRDATDNVWKLFSGITDEPTTTMNFDQAVYNYLKTGGLYINSSASTTTASISAAGSGYFTGLSISGSAVATEAYVLANAGVGNAQKEAYTITGDSASTSFVVNHTLNTRDVNVQVYQTSATPDTQYSEVEVDIVRTTASAVTVSFASAPTTGVTYRVVIVG